LADYVLIDTPPLLVVADAVSLFSVADAVLICSRVNSTTIEEAHEVRTLLQRTGAHALGLVAGGAKSPRHHRSDGYGYYVDSARSEASSHSAGSKT
jgi:Mrp family chromosome partitioning ATPase